MLKTITLAPRRLRLEDFKTEISLGRLLKFCIKKECLPWVPSLARQTEHSEKLFKAAGEGHYHHVTDGEPKARLGRGLTYPVI